MKKYIFILLVSLLACDSRRINFTPEFYLMEHDVSVSRDLFHKSQGIGLRPVCKLGFNSEVIWVKACQENKDPVYYVISIDKYILNPDQRNSEGYQEFKDVEDFMKWARVNVDSFKWDYEF